jgi:acetoin utilization deacetylase AcuC-like enzyme
MVAVLEGGYAVNHVGKIASAFIAEMSGTRYFLRDNVSNVARQTRMLGEKIIAEVKKTQQTYWNVE